MKAVEDHFGITLVPPPRAESAMPSGIPTCRECTPASTPGPRGTTFCTCGIQIITKTKIIPFWHSPSMAPQIAWPQESRIACTFFAVMWQTRVVAILTCGDQSHIRDNVRRSIAHTRQGTQDSDFFSKKNLRLVTAPKMQSSRQELLRLEN